MTQQGTLLKVTDNSGAKLALCIRVLRKGPRTRGKVGDTIVVTLKKCRLTKRIGPHQVCKALIVRDSKNLKRKDGSYIRFDKPACIILKKDRQPLARKIHGPVNKELRFLGHIRLISIASRAL